MEFDFFTILPLAIAVFVFWKLRSVLGTRNGAERPPYEPYQPPRDEAENNSPDSSNDNVVHLPGTEERQSAPVGQKDPIAAAIDAMDDVDATTRKGLKAIHSRDSAFEPVDFLAGAKVAYEMIVTAFAEGDKRTLKGLLAREVFENFEGVIDDRANRGEHVTFTFVGIEQARFTGAELVGDEAQVTVSFVSQIISATHDADQELIEGDLQEVAEITDAWTFARPAPSRDPNWKLIATDA